MTPTGHYDLVPILLFVGFALIGGLISVLAWFAKRTLDQILVNQELQSRQHTQCRDTLTDRFADKKETREDIKSLYGRVDGIDTILARGGFR